MLNKLLISSAIATAVSVTAPAHATAFSQTAYMNHLLADRLTKVYGLTPSANSPITIDVAVYVHPIYLHQSYFATKSTSSGPQENGSQFALHRINSMVSKLNEALAASVVKAKVKVNFVSLTTPDFPILSSTGTYSFKMPDGVTTVTKDSEYFEYLMQDWQGATTKYGFDTSNVTRRIKAATGADLHIFIRPHLDERMVEDKFVTPLLESYPNVPRPLVDESHGGAGFEFGSMTIYDKYWSVGYQGVDPNQDYVLLTAAHQFGHVLQAGHEAGKETSKISYARAFACGGHFTVMNAEVTEKSLAVFSSPNISFEGEFCGSFIGNNDEADNREVLINNTPLVGAYAEPKSPTSTVSLSAESHELIEGNEYVITVKRTGDLAEEAFVTLIGENSSATEGYLVPSTGQVSTGADYIFGMPTVNFAPNQDTATVKLTIPIRAGGSLQELFFIKAQYAANTLIDPDRARLSFAILPNSQVPEKTITLSLTSTPVKEGDKVMLPVTRNLGQGVVTAKYSAQDQTAKNQLHYKLVGDSVTFADGEVGPKFIEVVAFNDGKYEKDMYFDVKLQSDDLPVANGSTRVFISEVNQPVIGTIAPQQDRIVVDDTFTELKIRLIRMVGSDESHKVSLRFRGGNSESPNGDYILPPPISFLHRETEKTAVVQLLKPVQSDQTLEIYSETLGEVTGTILITKQNRPIVTVSTNVTAAENAEKAPIIINRDNGNDRIQLTVTYTEGTAKAGIDFKSETTSVVMEPGVKSTTFNVPIINRKDVNGDRGFTVKFTSSEAIISVAETAILITDVVKPDDGKSDKIDNYAGTFGWISTLLVLLMFRRRDS